jgi:hypothetical protein
MIELRRSKTWLHYGLPAAMNSLSIGNYNMHAPKGRFVDVEGLVQDPAVAIERGTVPAMTQE